MAVYRLVRFTIDPADTEEMLATRVALVAATRDAFPGLTEARLAKVDETWIDMWRWDSLARAQAAIEGAPALPEAGAAFSLIKDVTADFAEIIDER
jgi:hypothetical protein